MLDNYIAIDIFKEFQNLNIMYLFPLPHFAYTFRGLSKDKTKAGIWKPCLQDTYQGFLKSNLTLSA